ncbi:MULTISPECIES: AraC family transcriptional regulator [unclassified Arcicella]|uniref:AraC family transcriptional regulator n=1 Tax=unclassified Arcicella TaxID=2644986 RepID=UPI00285F684D|nr:MULTISPECIES: AraC family transcriptional regulator [unclassified Arcicella]MDR6564352.1 AraC-like DNA-binding protein [Arcicella sp. BE51]MDR6814102.1 AraC-like DNA-binding protein [Arcicella sp. BE140]MDR6825414.1 AraC-like DNA-binding protein [Arcicella sp. BE139]
MLIRNYFSLLNVDYVKLDASWNFNNVISPYYRLYYIDGGEGTISNAETTIHLKAGHLYLIPSFTLCNLTCNNFLSQYFIQFFEESPDGLSLFTHSRTVMELEVTATDIANFHRILTINPGRGINRSDNPKVYEKDIFYKEYQQLNNLQSISIRYETQGILFQLIARFLAPPAFKYNQIDVTPSVVMDAISYIQLNINQPLTVSHLANRANLNVDYFSRIFHQSLGKSPIKYILEKRIERAQYLITTTNKQMSDIALDTGFDNLQYFSRIFKRITGLTPGEYRNQSWRMGFL